MEVTLEVFIIRDRVVIWGIIVTILQTPSSLPLQVRVTVNLRWPHLLRTKTLIEYKAYHLMTISRGLGVIDLQWCRSSSFYKRP